MPQTPDGLRVLARVASGSPPTARRLGAVGGIKREVREIHVRLFYRPLLSAVAALPADEQQLSTAQAHDRLAAIGFRDPAGAFGTSARSRGAEPQGDDPASPHAGHDPWFADGVDPDYGLLAFRRISERLGDTLVPADAARLVRGGRAAHPVLSGRATSAS
jgi:glutamate-ammonia-ligase adenylyltransferase